MPAWKRSYVYWRCKGFRVVIFGERRALPSRPRGLGTEAGRRVGFSCTGSSKQEGLETGPSSDAADDERRIGVDDLVLNSIGRRAGTTQMPVSMEMMA